NEVAAPIRRNRNPRLGYATDRQAGTVAASAQGELIELETRSERGRLAAVPGPLEPEIPRKRLRGDGPKVQADFPAGVLGRRRVGRDLEVAGAGGHGDLEDQVRLVGPEPQIEPGLELLHPLRPEALGREVEVGEQARNASDCSGASRA